MKGTTKLNNDNFIEIRKIAEGLDEKPSQLVLDALVDLVIEAADRVAMNLNTYKLKEVREFIGFLQDLYCDLCEYENYDE